jgi:hypothetical protein
MTRQPIFVEGNKKPPKPKADDQSHEPAKHIEETARLSSSVSASSTGCAPTRFLAAKVIFDAAGAS